jgi:hypothetical protein
MLPIVIRPAELDGGFASLVRRRPLAGTDDEDRAVLADLTAPR